MTNLNKSLPLHSVLFVGLTLFGFGSAQAEKANIQLNQQQWQAMGIQTAQAQAVSQVPTMPMQAIAMMPIQSMQNFNSPIDGQIVELRRVHGEVAQGEVIMVLDSAQLVVMQTELLGVVTELQVANKSLQRSKQLNASGVTSTKQLQAAQALVTQLRSQLAEKKETLRLAGFDQARMDKLLKTNKTQGSKLNISAPVAGQLDEMQIRLGQRLIANQALFSMGTIDPIVLDVRVPVSMRAQLEEGMAVAVDGFSEQGEIRHLENQIDELTQTFEVHVIFSNPQRKILPGQSVSVRFLTSQSQAYRAPINAVAQFDGETVVFTQPSAQKVATQAVHILQMDAENMYFTADKFDSAMPLITQGTTAIKLALSASEEE
jgi:RND family efflux transporter MFP subunit